MQSKVFIYIVCKLISCVYERVSVIVLLFWKAETFRTFFLPLPTSTDPWWNRRKRSCPKQPHTCSRTAWAWWRPATHSTWSLGETISSCQKKDNTRRSLWGFFHWRCAWCTVTHWDCETTCIPGTLFPVCILKRWRKKCGFTNPVIHGRSISFSSSNLITKQRAFSTVGEIVDVQRFQLLHRNIYMFVFKSCLRN